MSFVHVEVKSKRRPKYLNVSTLSGMSSLIWSSNDVTFFSLRLLPNIMYWVFSVLNVNCFTSASFS